MAQHIIEGSGPPSTAPTAKNIHYLDTLNGDEYYSVGTAAVEDWKIRVSADATGGGGGGIGSPNVAHIQMGSMFEAMGEPVSGSIGFDDTIRVSEDGTKTWTHKPGSKYTDASPNPDYPSHPDWRNFLDGSIHADGEIVLVVCGQFVDDSLAADSQRITITRDLGDTWEEVNRIDGNTSTTPAFAYIAQDETDPDHYVIFRTQDSVGDFGIWFLESTDAGATWSNGPFVDLLGLRQKLDAGNSPAHYGFWNQAGTWFVAVSDTLTNPFDSLVFGSTNLATWSTQGLNCQNGGAMSATYAGPNVSGPPYISDTPYTPHLKTPLGVFFFCGTFGDTDTPAIFFNATGGISDFAFVWSLDDNVPGGGNEEDWAAAYTVPDPQLFWEHNMRGYTVDPDTLVVTVWAALWDNTLGVRYIISTTDGTNWSGYPIVDYGNLFGSGIGAFNASRMPGFWDGGHWFSYFKNASQAVPFISKDSRGFFRNPYHEAGVQDVYWDQTKNNECANWWPVGYQ